MAGISTWKNLHPPEHTTVSITSQILKIVTSPKFLLSICRWLEECIPHSTRTSHCDSHNLQTQWLQLTPRTKATWPKNAPTSPASVSLPVWLNMSHQTSHTRLCMLHLPLYCWHSMIVLDNTSHTLAWIFQNRCRTKLSIQSVHLPTMLSSKWVMDMFTICCSSLDSGHSLEMLLDNVTHCSNKWNDDMPDDTESMNSFSVYKQRYEEVIKTLWKCITTFSLQAEDQGHKLNYF